MTDVTYWREELGELLHRWATAEDFMSSVMTSTVLTEYLMEHHGCQHHASVNGYQAPEQCENLALPGRTHCQDHLADEGRQEP